ncbi:MAG: caspase family protein [Alphaproteobacteria bacterium]
MRNAFATLRHAVATTAAAALAAATLAGPALALDDDTFDDVAIIIGNKNYASGVAPVEFAHNDAEAMKKFVVEVLGFDPENVIVLKDATKNQMETHFSKGGILEDWVEPNGNSDIVVFYSGHGVPGLEDSNSYLLPVDGNPNKAEISGYPLAEFYANLKALKAKSITVYLDACFSGDSGGGVLFRDASPVFQAARKTVAPAELTVLTASQADQIASWDREAGHGLFTNYLLNALYGEADGSRYGNGDGQVTMSEVNAYLSRNMSRAARRTFGRQQQPAFSGKDDTVVARFDAGNPPLRPQLVAAAATKPAPQQQQQPLTTSQPLQAQPLALNQQQPAQQPIQQQQQQQRLTALPPATQTGPQLVPLDETYVTIKNSNVRSEPSVRGAKVVTLPVGTRITALAKVQGEDWYLIAQNGQEIGYIYGTLVMPEAQGMAMLQQQQQARQQRTVQRQTTTSSALAGTPSGAPPPRQIGLTRVYLQGVANNNGADMGFVSDSVRNVIASLPNAQILGSSQMNNADVVVSGRVGQVNKRTMANPEAQGAAMARAVFGNLGRAMTANVAPTVDVYRVEIMLSALDRHTGRTTIERGVHEEKVATGTPSGQVIGAALQQAASRAAQSLMMRVAGTVPAPAPTAQQQQVAPQQQDSGAGAAGALFNMFNNRNR